MKSPKQLSLAQLVQLKDANKTKAAALREQGNKKGAAELSRENRRVRKLIRAMRKGGKKIVAKKASPKAQASKEEIRKAA